MYNSKQPLTRMTNPLNEHMGKHVKDKEIYTVILNSIDTIQEFRTSFNKRSPPAVATPDPNDDEANIDPGDPNHIDNNDELIEDIEDTRKAVFKVDWGAVLPHQYKKFHMDAYFVSQLCVQASSTLPNIEDYQRGQDFFGNGQYNTSDGLPLSDSDGYFLKVCIDGINSSNVYDSKNGGMSSCVSLVKRTIIPYVSNGVMENRYVYETMSPQLCSPVINYPSNSIITVNIMNDQLEPIYLESFLYRDYDDNTSNTIPEIEEDVDAGIQAVPAVPGENYYTTTPKMSNWSLVLSFRPIE